MKDTKPTPQKSYFDKLIPTFVDSQSIVSPEIIYKGIGNSLCVPFNACYPSMPVGQHIPLCTCQEE